METTILALIWGQGVQRAQGLHRRKISTRAQEVGVSQD